MGKKQKKQQQIDPVDFGAMIAAMTAPPTREEFLKRSRQMTEYVISGFARQADKGRMRYVTSSRSVLPSGAVDTVLAVALSPEGWRQNKLVHASAGYEDGRPIQRTVIVGVVDAAQSQVAYACLDVEDAKKFVNALSEAIAETERITAEA